MNLLKNSYSIAIWIALLVALYFIKLQSYLIFHFLVELFSMIIAFGVFMFGWSSREYLKNNYLLFISIASLFIGFFDLTHAFAYKGMGLLNEKGANSATQLWIIARYTEAISFLIGFIFIKRALNITLTLSIYSLLFVGLVYTILTTDIFPNCYIEGEGLTTFKLISEYIIISIFAINLYLLKRNNQLFDKKVKRDISIAFSFTILSELSFTLYSDVYGHFNMLGHYFKLISFFYLYQAIIYTGVKNPLSLLSKELEQKNLELFQQSYFVFAGKLMSNISHHWRQPLSSISLSAQVLQDEYEFDELTKDSLYRNTDIIIQNSEELSHIISRVSGLFHEDRVRVKVDLKESITKTIDSLNYPDRVKIEIVDTLNSKICTYSKYTNKVLFNILRNAKEIIEKRAIERAKLKITITKDGDFAKILIEDNAGGIDSDIISRVFEPYFSTKFKSKNIGLGLYISKLLIEVKMQGRLSVENTEDGAKFKIKILDFDT